MYGRNRYRGNWYMAAFWLVIGVLIGQVLRFDIDLQPRESTASEQTQYTQLN